MPSTRARVLLRLRAHIAAAHLSATTRRAAPLLNTRAAAKTAIPASARASEQPRARSGCQSASQAGRAVDSDRLGGVQALTSAPYEVHYNSNRLGIRLTGPKPEFARADGGEGGGHPSNVHDHVYALGTINMSGACPS